MSDLRASKRGLDLVDGFTSVAVAAGIKASGKPDLSLIVSDGPCVVGGVFTSNQAAAPPVQYCRRVLRRAEHRAVVVNAGNANCATGAAGLADAKTMAAHSAQLIGCKPAEVLVCSTGVIGVPLPMDKVCAGIDAAHAGLGKRGQPRPATAILTTDTRVKERAYRHSAGYALAGIAKGSGMIHPNMATMLGFVLTDAVIAKADLQAITTRATARSFNRISVDNDESTNDTLLVLASGASGKSVSSARALAAFEDALTRLCQELAQDIVRDGEGATSFIEVCVTGTKSEAQANKVASAVCDSMLVKTAFAGRDPNWGRIAAAAGYSGVKFKMERMTISLNGVVIFSQGGGHDDRKRPFVKVGGRGVVKRADLAKSMTSGDQRVVIDLGQGDGAATRWTSDLTHGYISINADYTT
ncbi:MAG: bifunctional glutamate N-acetyltransferase/amino-acid acetyltransferase ArgJ [Planctomycetota bacterium]|nr:bifunctional glutamate N-acetyltransferase/amino-acid acetyltransferase ArgJ [Planctomycetota bacterium]